jgi:cytochrome c2
MTPEEHAFLAAWKICSAWDGQITKPVLRKAIAAALKETEVPIELEGVAEAIAEGPGSWRSCSGCHELNEGHPTGPWSDILKSHLGLGCRECGGIGAVWDSADYSDIKETP